jgi:hypothetical protein
MCCPGICEFYLIPKTLNTKLGDNNKHITFTSIRSAQTNNSANETGKIINFRGLSIYIYI